MDLIAISYQNIGPFENKTKTVFFKKGKYLIKAPIGTGKSFLFFDGPMFGLYKYGTRNMLNRKSKDGFVKVLFENEGSHYIIHRYITMTKSGGDSVQSSFFELPDFDLSMFDLPEIVNDDIDLYEYLSSKTQINEITFKSGTELQASLQDFLPLREVFVSTNFLMQDGENIFEMNPADRINVFKNIFGLLGIDEAKDIIGENRNNMKQTLKIRQDTSLQDSKLKDLLERLLSDYTVLKDDSFFNSFDGVSQILELNIRADLLLFADKLNVRDFDIGQIDLNIFENVLTNIETKKLGYQNLLGKLQTIQRTNQTLDVQISQLKRQNIDFQNQKKNIQNLISTLDASKVDTLKTQKLQNLEQQKKLTEAFDYNNFSSYGITDLFGLTNMIDTFTHQGKTLKSQLDNIDLQMTNLGEKKLNLENTLKILEQRIASFSQDLQKQQNYFCQKINADCPYVSDIKGKADETLQKQLQSFEAEKLQVETNIQNLDFSVKMTDFENQKKQISAEIQKIKDFFGMFDRKLAQNNMQEYKSLDDVNKTLDVQITKLELEINKIKDYQNEIISLQSKISANEEQIKSLKTQSSQLAEEIIQTQNTLDGYNFDSLARLQRILENMKNSFEKVMSLIKEFKTLQLQIKQLQEDIKIYDDLYNVFSKEFMLFVLQDFLPVLESAINNYLQQVVDYELVFELVKKTGDKLELEINITDSKGQRQVKSLSGGQKTILKLVWILAVSSMSNAKFLFLDETINNLDSESITKVAEMIEDFVKLKDMKFYVVTHSQQIQNMQIWDGVVELV